MQPKPVFRFAPSPNGRLHLGHAYSALLNSALARDIGGRFLIRIEDIDTTRCTAQLADECLSDLDWLGLRSDGPVRVQSQHREAYAAALERLRATGLLYRCFCTRTEIAHSSHDTDPDGAALYPGTCRKLTEGEIAERLASQAPHSWRMDLNRALATLSAPLYYPRFTPSQPGHTDMEAKPQRWGDVILARKDIGTSYHLSVVVDDAIQGITHVVRGQDLEASTCIHRLLQALLQLPVPLYHHHALLMTQEGDKLSKSKQAEPLSALREQGVTAVEIRQRLGF